MAYLKRSMSAKERLAAKSVVKENGCIEFTGYLSTHGYGEIAFNGKKYGAHKLSYIAHIGPVKKGEVVCHRCDNPACINPDHLFTGTQAENLIDAMRKGRMVAPNPRGERHGLSKLTEKDIPKILQDARPQREIAKEYGVAQSTIKNVKLRRTWSHITI